MNALNNASWYLKSFPIEAEGWKGGIYFKRLERLEKIDISKQSDLFNVKTDGSIEISSRMWTETESTGFGIYQYVEGLCMKLPVNMQDISWLIEVENPNRKSINVGIYVDDVLEVKEKEIEENMSFSFSFESCAIYDEACVQVFINSKAENRDESSFNKLIIKRIEYSILPKKEAKKKKTIFLASDSTVQTYDDFYYPQTGWGQTFITYVCPNEKLTDYQAEDMIYPQCHVYERESILVENRSIGARSSRSFIDEGKWELLLKRANPGDYLLMQWAHNDATAVRPNRFVKLSDFDEFLMKYVRSAKVRGINLIFVTPVSRRNCDENEGYFPLSFGDYADIMIALAKRENIPCVDLCRLSNDYLKKIGAEEAKNLYLWAPKGAYPDGAYSDGVSDNTHLSEYGAKIYGKLIVKELLAIEGFDYIDELKKYLDDSYNPKKPEIKLIKSQKDPLIPSGFSLLELNIEAKQVNFLLIWDDVEGAVKYNVYRKGSVDFQFFTLKSISAEEKKTATVLPFVLPAGDVYRVNVTAVFNDGRESKPSRTIEFRG